MLRADDPASAVRLGLKLVDDQLVDTSDNARFRAHWPFHIGTVSMRSRRVVVSLMSAGVLFTSAAPALPALASHDQPVPDISQMTYAPIGHFKPGDAIPPANTGCCLACVTTTSSSM